MAFSVLSAFKLYVTLVITCSCVLAEIRPARKGYANPYVLVRLKRSPQRAFTFSGFDPSNGLAAFATGADYYPYYQYPALGQVAYPKIESRGEAVAPSSNALSTEYTPPNFDYKPPTSEYVPPSSDYKQPTFDYKPPSGEFQATPDYTSAGILDEDPKAPAQNLTPPSDQPPTSFYDLPAPGSKKSKKKPVFPAASTDDDEDEVGNSKSKGSSSSASFNAWFPIVLGMYPSSQHSRNSAAETFKDANGKDAAASGKDPSFAAVKDQYEPAPVGRLGTTVIANSVSHGKSSVASSHAIAYGGDVPSRTQPYRNKGYE